MKKFGAVFIFLFCVFFLPALEFGFAVNDTFVPENITEVTDLTWTNYTSLSGWLSHSFNDNVNIIVSAGGRLEVKPDEILYKLYFGNTAVNFTFFNEKTRHLIESSVGRIYTSDAAGALFNGLMDGASFSYFVNNIQLRASASYTGLILESDLSLNKTESNIQDPNMLLSTEYEPRRVIATLSASNISFLKSRISLAAELIGNIDVNPGAKIHAQYASLSGLFTLLPGSLYISAYAVGSVAEKLQENKTDAGFAAGLSADFMVIGGINNFADKTFLKARFASGPSISSFYPVVSSSTAIAVDLPFTGITQIQLGNTLRKNNFSATLSGSVYLRDPKQDIFEPGALANGAAYAGSEILLGFSYAPFGDLHLNVSGACFFPGTAFSSGTPIRWSASAGLTIAF